MSTSSKKCQMRCQRCRMWIDTKATDTKLPVHDDPMGDQCTGSNQRPAEKRGPFRS